MKNKKVLSEGIFLNLESLLKMIFKNKEIKNDFVDFIKIISVDKNIKLNSVTPRSIINLMRKEYVDNEQVQSFFTDILLWIERTDIDNLPEHLKKFQKNSIVLITNNIKYIHEEERKDIIKDKIEIYKKEFDKWKIRITIVDINRDEAYIVINNSSQLRKKVKKKTKHWKLLIHMAKNNFFSILGGIFTKKDANNLNIRMKNIFEKDIKIKVVKIIDQRIEINSSDIILEHLSKKEFNNRIKEYKKLGHKISVL